MGILFPLLAIIIHHSAVFSNSVEAQMYNRKQKNVISLQGRIQEFLIFFFFWEGGGGPNFGFKRTVELICLSICERRSPLAREPALQAEAN